MAEHFDVIIVGTGAGGRTMARTLAASGKRTVCCLITPPGTTRRADGRG